MTVEQIHELWVAAGGLENREDQPQPLSTGDRLAAVRRNELKRIWNLMTEDGWQAYSPVSDPDVHRWHQAQQERESGEAAGPDPELVRYRIVAQRTDPEHPGASVLTNYAYGRSVGDAVAKVRKALEKPGGLYGDQGLYRVVEVVEESPDSELRQQEETRRRYLTTILENATATVRGRELEDPDAELVSRLDDFFTRAVVFPDAHTPGVHPRPHQATFGWTSEHPYIEHASDPGRALALFLLAYLDHYGLNLEASVRTGDRPDAQPVSGGRPSARDAEGGEAPAELVERVLAVCGQHYAAVTGTSSDQWDQESDREVVGIALRTVRMAERDAYPQTLETYLHERRARLERLWQHYGPDGMFAGEVVLIDLPACFVLCERIDHTPLWLEGIWAREGQEETALERLQSAWLYDTAEKDGR
ncbi:hypothetical protein ACFFS2_40980 [Streptomyces aurantiacus]|uniref:Uncharacterized protein n=1 Tax=Streptomyces aurantiacus TaxID=47760 RepID=A0A7G1PHE7_9ACTN|nr:hypothetical protein [Streptomyces aurantiacus]BCL33450.1 hypothetical protein GCM10017557_83090 [Streptomyces aurantiacus]